MTGWMSEIAVRHVPEEELHAYLDQALSRSQCVEIECHLAECRNCRTDRDRVAAVRDRTTALLADAAPRRLAVAPPFEQLVASHRERTSARIVSLARFRRVGLLAAGLVAAVGAGWWGRGVSAPSAVPTSVAAATAPVPERTLVAIGTITPADSMTGMPSIRVSRGPRALLALSVRARSESPLVTVADRAPEAAVQVSALVDEDAAPLDGLWQTVDLAQAAAETGGNVPRIEGLAILDIQLQHSQGDERPIVVVAQQHPSGRIIRTIEGPMDRVQDLVMRHRTQSAGLHASQPDLTPPDYLSDGTVSARRGLRILTVTGLLPSDSLNALARSIALKE